MKAFTFFAYFATYATLIFGPPRNRIGEGMRYVNTVRRLQFPTNLKNSGTQFFNSVQDIKNIDKSQVENTIQNSSVKADAEAKLDVTKEQFDQLSKEILEAWKMKNNNTNANSNINIGPVQDQINIEKKIDVSGVQNDTTLQYHPIYSSNTVNPTFKSDGINSIGTNNIETNNYTTGVQDPSNSSLSNLQNYSDPYVSNLNEQNLTNQQPTDSSTYQYLNQPMVNNQDTVNIGSVSGQNDQNIGDSTINNQNVQYQTLDGNQTYQYTDQPSYQTDSIGNGVPNDNQTYQYTNENIVYSTATVDQGFDYRPESNIPNQSTFNIPNGSNIVNANDNVYNYANNSYVTDQVQDIQTTDNNYQPGSNLQNITTQLSPNGQDLAYTIQPEPNIGPQVI